MGRKERGRREGEMLGVEDGVWGDWVWVERKGFWVEKNGFGFGFGWRGGVGWKGNGWILVLGWVLVGDGSSSTRQLRL